MFKEFHLALLVGTGELGQFTLWFLSQCLPHHVSPEDVFVLLLSSHRGSFIANMSR